MNNMVHTVFIAYDRDDKFEQKELHIHSTPNESNENSIVNHYQDKFFDNKFFGMNEWSEITEPVCNNLKL